MGLGARKLATERLIQQSGRSARRYLDLSIEWWIDGDDEPLAVFGDRWDTQKKRYSRAAWTTVPMTWHAGQAPAARWFCDWLAEHIEYRQLINAGDTKRSALGKVYSDTERLTRALLYGGRGSGKTFLASGCAAAYAVAVPESRIVVLCPFKDHTTEVRDAILRENLATEWRDFRITDNVIELVNGSRIELMTARGKRDCKVGSCDLVIINEAQEIPQQLIDDLLRLDNGGIQILTCNPPRSQKGAWLMEWHEAMLRGERPESIQFFLDPQRNPHIPPDEFTSRRRLLGKARFNREYRGDMSAPLTDVVFDAYSEGINKLDYVPIDWVDVTAEVAERYYDAPGARWVLGLDFDLYGKRKGCTWAAGRFYRRPTDPHECLVIEMAESLIPGEERLAARLHEVEHHGYRCFTPDRTVLVCDASSRDQNTEREWEKPTSWERLEQGDWTQLRRPDAALKKNPEVWLRLSTGDHLLRRIPGAGGREPRVYVMPEARCVRDSLRYYPVKRNGAPDRRSEHAHPADCWTYMAWRRWGQDREIVEVLASQRAHSGPRYVPRPERHL